MWGTRPCAFSEEKDFRFIPTHVGNTERKPKPPNRKPVHPHACGEHVFHLRGLTLDGGSSPRMWGTLKKPKNGKKKYRFIPTHVGNTAFRSAHRRFAAVHPHACGEHTVLGGNMRLLAGSSPRMWGTHPYNGLFPRYCRFIPTHVGNTPRVWVLMLKRSVHPHACGEHQRSDVQIHSANGSSPRMWGTPPGTGYKCTGTRFIPTHVGNTRSHRPGGTVPAVHPHACGEHFAGPDGGPWPCGSSPRMWGTRFPRLAPKAGYRFIPTHVGNTNNPAGCHNNIAVHPHACGEHRRLK